MARTSCSDVTTDKVPISLHPGLGFCKMGWKNTEVAKKLRILPKVLLKWWTEESKLGGSEEKNQKTEDGLIKNWDICLSQLAFL